MSGRRAGATTPVRRELSRADLAEAGASAAPTVVVEKFYRDAAP
ncbi:hypothetical protein [Nocardia testacea]